MSFNLTEKLNNLTHSQRTALYLFIAACGVVFLIMLGILFYLIKDLPDTKSLIEYRPKTITHVYSKDGEKIGEFYRERRTVVAIEQVPEHVLKSFLSAEDAGFWDHQGIDYIAILRCAIKNTFKGKMCGGSTITQQVAKTFFLSSERKITRKIKEAVLAKRIEDTLTKEEILHLYINQIYFGSGAYGLQSAAEKYFGKDVEELTLAEGALIAGLPKAPSRFSPYKNYPRAKIRQEWIIQRMMELGHITREVAEDGLNEKLNLLTKKMKTLWSGQYFTEHVRRYVAEAYGEELLYQGGLHIYTTMDVSMQKAGNRAVDKNLRAHDKRRGYRGPIKTIEDPEEVAKFLSKIDKDLENKPLEKAGIYKGIIVEVDEKNKNLVVHIGHNEGVITASHMKWAKKYIPEGSTEDHIWKVERNELLVEPITIFKVGEVIDVKIRVLPEVDDETPILLKLEQEPLAEASLIAMDSATGEVRAMVGGSSFGKTQFNRSVQALRQPGSAFKPIVYSAALDSGYTPATIIIDSPIVFEHTTEGIEPEPELDEDGNIIPREVLRDKDGKVITETEIKKFFWAPKNDGGRFYGPTTLRTALTKSRNIVTIKIANEIGVKKITANARALGITSPLNNDLSMAIGSSALTPMEITTAFAAISNLGTKTEPLYISKIVDRFGKILEESEPLFTQALSPQTAYITTSLLQGVVQSGTGWRARALGRPAGGKTGTTNGLNDAWFVGFIPGLTASAWMGYDEEKTLGKGEYGGRAAGPIWVDFMKEATKDLPIENFPIPEGVEFVKIDKETGKLPDDETYKKMLLNEELEPKDRKKVILFEVFKKGTAPTTFSGSNDPNYDDNQPLDLSISEGGIDNNSNSGLIADNPEDLDRSNNSSMDDQEMLDQL